MPQEHDDEIRFRPTSGRIMGSLAVIAALAVVGIAVVGPRRGAWTGGCGSCAARRAGLGHDAVAPASRSPSDDLVLRTMVEHQRLPLAAIEDLAVRQVLAVRVGEKRYVSTAVGKSWRKAMVGDRQRHPQAGRRQSRSPRCPTPTTSSRRSASAWSTREPLAGVGLLSDEQLALAAGVRRAPAWLPIGLMTVATVALLVTILF